MKKIVYELIICLVTVTIFLVSGPVYAFQTVTSENQATEVPVPTSTKTGKDPLKNRKTAEPVVTSTETGKGVPEKRATQEPEPTNTAAVTASPEKRATQEPEPTNTAAVTASPEKRATKEPVPTNTAAVTASSEKQATKEPEPTNTAAVTASPENKVTEEPVSVIDYVLSSNPETAAEPQRERPETPDAQYHQIFKFSQNIVIQGIFEKSGLSTSGRFIAIAACSALVMASFSLANLSPQPDAITAISSTAKTNNFFMTLFLPDTICLMII